ncbi:hypothetical protein C0J52_16301 [Blattella germanica]|nr:hypothetical protein C0J52_16301 [Blattella germanica]
MKYNFISYFLIMKAVIQRVVKASVSVEGEVISAIGKGICVLVGISRDDTKKDMEYIRFQSIFTKMSENLTLAIEEMRKGSTLRAAAAKFVSLKRGPKTIFNEYEEKELVTLLLSASRKGFPLTPNDIRRAAFEYAEMCN